MSYLRVWTAEEEEWVIAESAIDACFLYCEAIGYEPAKEAEDSDWGTHPEQWTALPNDRVLRWSEECSEIHTNGMLCPRQCDDFFIRTKLTCKQHVAKSGRGYLGSANY